MKFFALSLLALPAAALAQPSSGTTGGDQTNAQQTQPANGQSPAGERRVCRYEEDSTSRMGRRRVCRTETQARNERD